MLSTILVFLIVLSVLVLIHEFGHFITAKKAGVLVEEFGIGLPPRVFGKKLGETLYSVNLLPFGGFVRLHGENSDETVTSPKRAFLNKSKKIRTVIIVAGVFMNFVLAIVAFAVVYFFSGIPKETNNVKIIEISADSPAVASGILVGDIVKKVENKNIATTEEFIKEMEAFRGKKVNLIVERNITGQVQTIKLSTIPRENPPQGEGPLGVAISTIEIYFPPLVIRPFVGVYYGFKDSLTWGKTVILGFVKLFTDLSHGSVPKDVAGPVGIFAITSQAQKFGILAVVNLMGVLSVNLAVLNIIPFPALDGGRLLFIFIEAIIGKKVIPKVESIIHTFGMVILLLLIFAITAHDIQRLIAAGSLSGFINSILK